MFPPKTNCTHEKRNRGILYFQPFIVNKKEHAKISKLVEIARERIIIRATPAQRLCMAVLILTTYKAILYTTPYTLFLQRNGKHSKNEKKKKYIYTYVRNLPAVFAFLMRREKVEAKSHLHFTAPPDFSSAPFSMMFPRGTNLTGVQSLRLVPKLHNKRGSWVKEKKRSP